MADEADRRAMEATEKSKTCGIIEMAESIPNPFEAGGVIVPLSHVGQKGKLMNVLHVPTITQNLVSIGQIINQGMQVRFTHLGCYIEEEGQVIAQGRCEGRMFILDTDQARTALFARGQKLESDIDLWHKRFGHVNFPRLREMQTKNIVFDLPKFRGRNGQVCEASQLGKQH